MNQSDQQITIKGIIKDPEGRVIAEGTATEYKGASNPKITENCETSAWGRALGNLGIGIDESIASADEMTSFYNAKPAAKDIAQYSTPKQAHPEYYQDEPHYEDALTASPCLKCGGITELKEGISPKSGKPWKGYKCMGCKEMRFLNSN